MSESLGNAVLDLTTDGSGLEKGLDQAEGTTKSKLKSIGGTIGKATMAGAAAFAAAGGAAAAAAFKTADYGDEVAKTAVKLGTNAESLQEMRVWADRNGISVQSLERGVGRLNQRIGRAIDGNEKYASAFEDVGVAIQDAEGNARATNDVMADTIQALSDIEDPALQSARASEIFGTKMARDLMPALQDGSLSMEDAAELAHELGVVMSDENAAAAEEFSDSWANIKDTVSGFIRDAAIPVMKVLNDRVFPVIQDGISTLRDLWDVFQEGDGVADGLKRIFDDMFAGGDLFSGLLDAARNVFNRLIEWLTSGGLQQILGWVMEARIRLFEMAMKLFPAILDAAIEFLPQLLEWITGTMIPQLLDFIVSGVPLLLDTAITLFTALVDAVVEVLPVLLETLLGEVLPQVLTTILEMIPDLLETAIEAFLALVDAVVKVLPTLLETLLGTVLPNVLSAIIEMLPDILIAAIETFTALVTAVAEVLPELITILLETVLPTLITTLIEMIPELLEVGIEVFLALVDAIIEIVPELVSTIITEVVPAVVDAVMQLGPELLQAGKDIIGNLIDGITSKIPDVGGAIGRVGDTIGRFLPGSPVKEGPLTVLNRGYAGELIAGMLNEGLQAGMPDVSATMNQMVDVDMAGASRGAGDTVDRSLHVTLQVPPGERVDSQKTVHRLRKAALLMEPFDDPAMAQP